jgi:GMC oxidoreductase
MTARETRVVIVGSGLGGAFAAHGLAGSHDVTVVELDAPVEEWQRRVVDVGAPAQLDPHVGAGLGGTTALWHNGLIEIDEDVFATRWPFPKSELLPFYAEAFKLLCGVPREVSEEAAAVLRDRYAKAGVRVDRTPHLFFPVRRRNAWESLALRDRVRLVRGEVVGFDAKGARVRRVRVQGAAGMQKLDADVVILAAGGLGTPPLLQALAEEIAFPGARHVGCFYEDHPMTFVGELTLRQPLYRFWNLAVPGTGGNLRMPLVVEQDGLQVSFQLRPAALYYRESRRQRLQSVITQLRNQPYNPINYLRLLRQWDDILDILSFRFGVRVPTKHYSLLMVAEQPARPGRAVWGERDPSTGKTMIHRRWTLPPEYLATLKRAAERFVAAQGDLVAGSRFFPDWERGLASAAHHSGTARVSATADDGVCDVNARAHGVENVYVADGSLIPASGIANTGLTIAALALRLAAHLRRN